jgi:hypothetical protein
MIVEIILVSALSGTVVGGIIGYIAGIYVSHLKEENENETDSTFTFLSDDSSVAEFENNMIK